MCCFSIDLCLQHIRYFCQLIFGIFGVGIVGGGAGAGVGSGVVETKAVVIIVTGGILGPGLGMLMLFRFGVMLVVSIMTPLIKARAINRLAPQRRTLATTWLFFFFIHSPPFQGLVLFSKDTVRFYINTHRVEI